MINFILSSLIAFLPTTVVKVADTDSSTIIYCTCTANVDAALPVKQAISRTTKVITEDGSYKLKRTYHMPIWNEADTREAYFSNPGQTLNFALEFEKFPLDAPFDLIENESKAGSLCIRNINASTGKPVRSLEDFLEATTYLEYGINYVNGHPREYYDDGDIRIESATGGAYQIGNKIYQSASFCIRNRGRESFSIAFDDVKAFDRDQNTLTILKARKANDVWHEMDQAQEVVENGLNVGQIAAGTIGSTAWRFNGEIGLAAMGLAMIVGGASNQVAENKITEQNKIRVEAMSHYFKGATITPAQEYSTFFMLKRNKKKDIVKILISVNGKTYEFIMN